MTNSQAASTAVRAAVEGGRVSAHEPTNNSAIDALLACVESTGQRIAPEKISAALRRRPVTADQAARALGVPVRSVDLAADPQWWRAPAEPLVVYEQETGEWVAALSAGRRTDLIRVDGSSSRVNQVAAAQISPQAWALIPTLPDHPIGLREAIRLGWTAGSGRDVLYLVAVGVVSMVIGTLIPIFSGLIIGTFVPTGELSSIVFVTMILILAAAVSALIVASQGIIVDRMAGRFGLRLTEAIYDRVFRLRTSFHREHVPGELSERIAGVDAFRSALASLVPASISALGALIASVLVIGALSGTLAVSVIVMSFLALGIGGLLMPRLAKDAQAYTAAGIELSGLTFSMLGGIAKLRTAGAEQRMLDRWTFRFAKVQRSVRDLSRRNLVLGLIAILPASIVPILLVFGEATGAMALSLGEFTTATAAAAQAAGAIAGLLPLAVGLVMSWPNVQALDPILEASPEPRGSAAEDPGPLTGNVSFDHVTFGYEPDAPVLRDVSFTVPAGSMTAIVGASGSGKSTIIRLLLGLEVPDAGHVLYDGHAMSSLDRSAVLVQMGIVPQDAALIPGSIMENIVASADNATEEDAWRAADQAGIGDDIRAMPMGLRTVVSDGASTFSGGQRQRLMIARALVHQPKILILDEATSALDNRTQEIVAQSIAAVGATRIVVAHRLSTIRAADQIVVLDAGRVVEIGTYGQLMSAGGLFAQLARRQIV